MIYLRLGCSVNTEKANKLMVITDKTLLGWLHVEKSDEDNVGQVEEMGVDCFYIFHRLFSF